MTNTLPLFIIIYIGYMLIIYKKLSEIEEINNNLYIRYNITNYK